MAESAPAEQGKLNSAGSPVLAWAAGRPLPSQQRREAVQTPAAPELPAGLRSDLRLAADCTEAWEEVALSLSSAGAALMYHYLRHRCTGEANQNIRNIDCRSVDSGRPDASGPSP